MTTEIKQYKNDDPDCDLCDTRISYNGYYLSFQKECSRGMEHEVVICEDCIDEQHRKIWHARFPKIPEESVMTNVNYCPLCAREGKILGENINLMECKSCRNRWPHRVRVDKASTRV